MSSRRGNGLEFTPELQQLGRIRDEFGAMFRLMFPELSDDEVSWRAHDCVRIVAYSDLVQPSIRQEYEKVWRTAFPLRFSDL